MADMFYSLRFYMKINKNLLVRMIFTAIIILNPFLNFQLNIFVKFIEALVLLFVSMFMNNFLFQRTRELKSVFLAEGVYLLFNFILVFLLIKTLTILMLSFNYSTLFIDNLQLGTWITFYLASVLYVVLKFFIK
jgi:hypothetical protein